MVRYRATKKQRRLILVAVLIVLLAYPFLIEPRWLEVTTHRETANVSEPLRIAFVGDLHTDGFGGVEAGAVEAIAAARPDLILLGGDLVHSSGKRGPVEQFIEALPEAPLGIWMVPGNWEYWRLGTSVADFYEPKNARWLVNTSTTIRSDVSLIGMDDALAGTPDPSKALAAATAPFKLAFLHSPSGVAALKGRVDMILGAHTHGGQARLPVIGPLVLPPGDGGYDMGWYDRGKTRVFITRGVGMSVIAARFGCRPEVAIIDLVPSRTTTKR